MIVDTNMKGAHRILKVTKVYQWVMEVTNLGPKLGRDVGLEKLVPPKDLTQLGVQVKLIIFIFCRRILGVRS
jgi:hypothetical protein